MMGRLIAERLLQALIALLALSAIVFLTSRITGNPLDLLLPIEATQEDYDRAAARLGLDRPLIVQYGVFLGDIVQGDLGRSLRSGEPVNAVLMRRLRASFDLAMLSLAMTMLLALPLGIISAKHRGDPIDAAVKVVALLGQAMPSFWFGILTIQIFAIWLGWVPAGTQSGFRSAILPAFTMATFGIAAVARLLRSSMIEVLDSDFIRLARAKGLWENSITWKHAVRNSLLTVVSFGGLLFVNMLSFAVVIEAVFAWPGIGSLAHSAVLFRDFPIIQGVAMLAGAIAILVNLGVDILYTFLDPRIRYGN